MLLLKTPSVVPNNIRVENDVRVLPSSIFLIVLLFVFAYVCIFQIQITLGVIMKRIAGFLGLLVAGLATAADTHPLLAQLSADLAIVRALPVGTKTSYSCPVQLNQLKGMTFTSILAVLPKPDHEDSGSVSYFLTSPIRPDQRGGGFPEIKFVLGKSGRVARITCIYSR